MRMIAVLGLVGISAALSLSAVAEDAEPKHSIKECMKTCFKGPLIKKVAGGEATDEEKAKLHEMMVAMAKATPKKGDAESWKTKTEALVKASKAAVEGDANAAGMLKKAANCKACHSVHK
ncbi:hypothetical protein CA51_36380 [Rosistilla oblonga]|uniref:Cytochrome C n=1 Tax=Rosistilla oblonga TaxID=2527990 RepID=A0A518IY99_9BACT|nr:hypothetical protein [Rosistilla oblonga]QDV13747.1 hypothetical protein CA51_36380 [Rosistilla oblonga]QDV58066.1 hypothetical protein Mal33_40830 [Rosistilla oblonga]